MFVAVLVAGLIVGWIVRSGPTEIAQIGQPAPEFSVEVFDGATFTLSEARGTPVVVNLWASWCPPCREEIPDISAFAEAHPEVQVIGVAVEDAERSARDFAAEIGASYPLAMGTTGFEDAYPNLGLPATYIIDSNGTITDVFNGIVDEEILEGLVFG
ncbi:MAG TPA: TlpA disulfide reductase family protein [Acidimicrobiia bacterium]|nr:TlpA disulfide reductase family protein [Acidimicrobiia bacterium]